MGALEENKYLHTEKGLKIQRDMCSQKRLPGLWDKANQEKKDAGKNNNKNACYNYTKNHSAN